jgi:hypothetical protein
LIIVLSKEYLPDGNGYCILIDYGTHSPSLQMSVFIEGQPDNFRMCEYKPYRIAPYTFDVWMEDDYDVNVLVFLNKLWNFIEKTVTSLENSNKS